MNKSMPMLLACLAALSACTQPAEDAPPAVVAHAAKPDPAHEAEMQALAEKRRLQGLWDYQDVQFDEGVQHSAAIYSKTLPAEEGEIAPVPDARLVLRDNPNWGRSAYLLLAQSKFACGKPCAMKIAFDDGAATKYAGKQADSGKGPALFIDDEKKFIAALKAAKLVKISLPKGSGLVTSLTFEVGGYDAARYH
jgi:hypothetical protein